MKKLMAAIIALLVLLMATPVMAAPATKTPFRAAGSFIPGIIDTGKVWITKDGIQHVKGAISEGTVSGDISGTFRLVSYETVNLNTGDGTNHGKFTLIVNGEDTFEGSFQSTVTMNTFSGTFVGRGTGMYRGQKIMGSHEGELVMDTIPVVEIVLEGIRLIPKG